jgi:hypothetical protein
MEDLDAIIWRINGKLEQEIQSGFWRTSGIDDSRRRQGTIGVGGNFIRSPENDSRREQIHIFNNPA